VVIEIGEEIEVAVGVVEEGAGAEKGEDQIKSVAEAKAVVEAKVLARNPEESEARAKIPVPAKIEAKLTQRFPVPTNPQTMELPMYQRTAFLPHKLID